MRKSYIFTKQLNKMKLLKTFTHHKQYHSETIDLSTNEWNTEEDITHQDHTFGKASPYLHEQVNQTQKRQISRNDKKTHKDSKFFRTIRQNRKEQRQREVRALMRPACRPLKSLKTSSTVRGVGLVNPSITFDPRRMN